MYELGISAFTDTNARERVVDFVAHFFAGTAWRPERTTQTA